MAIEFKTIDGWQAAKACGVGSTYIDKLKSHGVTVQVTPSKTSFMKGKETLAGFMCKSAIIGDVASGKAEPSMGLKVALQNAASMALAALQSPAAKPEVLPAEKTTEEQMAEDMIVQQVAYKVANPEAIAKKIDAIKAVREITGLGLKEAKDVIDGVNTTMFLTVSQQMDLTTSLNSYGALVHVTKGGEMAKAVPASMIDLLVKSSKDNVGSSLHTIEGKAEVFPLSQMQHGEPVVLAQATMMYQPVQGTSAGSRYFVVAMRSDLKVAARLSHGKLSVRVEGLGLAKFSDNLDSAGFSPGAKYRSLHLNPGNDLFMAGRTLGSVLVGMDIEFTTMTPKVSVINGKGG